MSHEKTDGQPASVWTAETWSRWHQLAAVVLELVAVAWVIFYYNFEPVIPIYQGY